MSKYQDIGNKGELEVIAKVKCPNCGKKLMRLPKGYPLVDVQCKACYFRAQVKSPTSEPKDVIFGAGWDILNKTLKSGYQIPNLIVNFKWNNGQEIIFFPFIPKANIKPKVANVRGTTYKMFNYIGLKSLPQMTLYKNK
jgi:DNA-directed RNA polymerase subunit RPC12/RpoP